VSCIDFRGAVRSESDHHPIADGCRLAIKWCGHGETRRAGLSPEFNSARIHQDLDSRIEFSKQSVIKLRRALHVLGADRNVCNHRGSPFLFFSCLAVTEIRIGALFDKPTRIM
jgi:hypothetical protein